MAAESGFTVRQLVGEIGRRRHRDGSGDRLLVAAPTRCAASAADFVRTAPGPP